MVILEPSATLSGTVRDAIGAPVPGLLVHLSVRGERSSTPILTASTDEDRRYELTGYRPRPEDESVVVSVSKALRQYSRTTPPAGLRQFGATTPVA